MRSINVHKKIEKMKPFGQTKKIGLSTLTLGIYSWPGKVIHRHSESDNIIQSDILSHSKPQSKQTSTGARCKKETIEEFQHQKGQP